MGEQSSQPPPVPPGDYTVSSQKSQQIIKLIGNPPQEIWPVVLGVWLVEFPPQEVTACFVVAKIHSW